MINHNNDNEKDAFIQLLREDKKIIVGAKYIFKFYWAPIPALETDDDIMLAKHSGHVVEVIREWTIEDFETIENYEMFAPFFDIKSLEDGWIGFADET